MTKSGSGGGSSLSDDGSAPAPAPAKAPAVEKPAPAKPAATVAAEKEAAEAAVVTEKAAAEEAAAAARAGFKKGKAAAGGFAVGDRVYVRDNGQALWEEGTVVEAADDDSPRVLGDGLDSAFWWDEVSKDLPPGAQLSSSGSAADDDGAAAAAAGCVTSPWHVGDRIFVRDEGEEWGAGTVNELDPMDCAPRVVQDGLGEAFFWDELSKQPPAGWAPPVTSSFGDDSSAVKYEVGETVYFRDNGEAGWHVGTVMGVNEWGDPLVAENGTDDEKEAAEGFYRDELTKEEPAGFVAPVRRSDDGGDDDDDDDGGGGNAESTYDDDDDDTSGAGGDSAQ
eukprot:CAMPEP_0172626186 /NCGR_PEP_ID=MMETSP1068-20121228/148518_1 /TAXON_ID=35684 /ORGANISM="Pseudopedinella elastica, Strain CCMP716" /LENGTH=335 /DNA_ID=CAMNT_0013435725 /DNA_START=189 /DNA_END=1196 /DNA_ORIENTATION=-